MGEATGPKQYGEFDKKPLEQVRVERVTPVVCKNAVGDRHREYEGGADDEVHALEKRET